MKRKALYLALIICVWLCCCVSSLLAAANSSGSFLEFRIAAHPDNDAHIEEKARLTGESEVRQGKNLLAKWVPVLAENADEFVDNPVLVSRRKPDGQVDLLVLVTGSDVTDRDVRCFRSALDRYGKLALEVLFQDAKPPKFYELTKSNIGRHLAQIIEGQVYSALIIESACYGGALVTGDFTEETISQIFEGSPFRLEPLYVSPPAFLITPLRVAIFCVIILFGILGLLPAQGLKESKHSRTWLAAGALVGTVVGGYLLGITRIPVRPETQTGGSIIVEEIHISILGGLFGALIGAALGILGGYVLCFLVRRAIHNTRVIFLRGFRKAEEPQNGSGPT